MWAIHWEVLKYSLLYNEKQQLKEENKQMFKMYVYLQKGHVFDQLSSVDNLQLLIILVHHETNNFMHLKG